MTRNVEFAHFIESASDSFTRTYALLQTLSVDGTDGTGFTVFIGFAFLLVHSDFRLATEC
jgi:hypothetical protein